jgi:hypothetical protein
VKVYISGPMTGYPEFNYPAFTAAAASLRSRGVDVISPHEVNPPEDVEREWSWYLRRDIAALMEADAIVRLPGSDDSRGSVLECHIGAALGMPIYELDPELDWAAIEAAS